MIRWVFASLALVATLANAQAPAEQVRLRGSIVAVDGNSITLKERSGETLTLPMAPDFSVSEVVPIQLSAIQKGAYIGTAAMPSADGTLKALEVVVFPEAARGTGEGFRGWDLLPGSTMTNATVADVVAAPQGRTIKVHYKDGEKTVLVPDDVPVVTLKPGDKSLLVPGAKIIVTAMMKDGKPTAMRASAGRNGFAPPM